jgi:hypothetical protein
MCPAPDSPADELPSLRAALDEQTRRLHVLHAARLQCRQGCSSCCVDGLTVFAVEAEPIVRRHGELLARGEPHAEGACAFLDAAGGCRIYEDRPYVCRTQGLPLRWLDDDGDGDAGDAIFERRDICPLNDADDFLLELAPDACWTLGPFEERLARLQQTLDAKAGGDPSSRISLRALFARS